MRKLNRRDLRKFILKEMEYTHHTIDDKGDGGYGIRKSDRGSISLEVRNVLNSIGVDYMDEDGVAFDGDERVSNAIVVERMSMSGMVELLLFYKGRKIASALEGQREAYLPIFRYKDAYSRRDFQAQKPAADGLARELESRYANNPDALEFANNLRTQPLTGGPLMVVDFNSYSQKSRGTSFR